MGIISSEDYTLVHGRGAGNSLIDALTEVEETAWILSLDIDQKYVRRLKQKSEEQEVDLKVITDASESLAGFLETHDTGSRSWLYEYRYIFMTLAVIGLAGSALSYQFESEMIYIPVIIAVVSIGLTLTAYFIDAKKTGYRATEELYLQASELTNSRIYILDDKVFIGSTDLTEDSLWKNFEYLFEFKTEKARENIKSLFEDITEEMDKDEKSMQELGEKIFED